MKMQTLNRFAPCMVAAIVALAANSARGQEVVLSEAMPIASDGSYVGDMPCTNCVDSGGDSGDGGVAAGFGSQGGGGLFGNGNRVVESTIQERSYGQPDLFYNYYTQGFANRANAQMYLSPVPVPPNVGHTFYTYQPFLPQHMLYPHHDRYHRYYDGGRGMNRTSATYWTSAHARAKNFYWNFLRLPR
jgi:hypothetical protein